MGTPAKELRVAICQMTSTDNVDANLTQMLTLLGDVPDLSTVDLVSFPENALFLRLAKSQSIPALSLEHSAFRELQRVADRHQVTLAVGSAPLAVEGGRLSNALVWLRPHAPPEVVYRKIHLFDVDVVGAPSVRESESFIPGDTPKMIELNGWQIGLSICYDVRFAELYVYYARAGADLVLVPSAFLVPTGQAHWHVLLRARAIESQCYVVAAAQAGIHLSEGGECRRTFGHSMVVDPWGEVVVDLGGEGHKVQVVDLDPGRLTRVRSQIPQAQHRRLSC